MASNNFFNSIKKIDLREAVGWIGSSLINFLRSVRNSWSWPALFEVGAIYLWALWFGRVFFDFSPDFVPLGNDLWRQIESYIPWQWLSNCGTCILWNGTANGGYPTFAELRGAVLHPLVIFSTLAWGVVNGAKMTLIGSMFLAGLAQWWLAKVMGLGRSARLWSAAMAVVGGHLAGRMEDGLNTMILSVATVSLVFAPLVELLQTGRRRSIIWLGITLALSILSGQGYLQIALVLAVVPALAVFLVDEQFRAQNRHKDLLKAGLLGILLSGIFLVPMLHFWPNFTKDSDQLLTWAQPLATMPFNLVIADMDFYRVEQLGHVVAPSKYILFIGWVPVLLAWLTLRLVPKEKQRLLVFFFTSILMLFIVSSREVLQVVMDYIPQVSFIRFPTLMTTLVVPLVLGLAAWALDLLLKASWPELLFRWSSGKSWSFSLAWLVLAIPLLLAIHAATANSGWYQKDKFPLPQGVLGALHTPTTEWVSSPYDEGAWILPMMDAGYKLTGVLQSWSWKDRQSPPPYLAAFRNENHPDPVYSGDGIQVTLDDKSEYTFVDTGKVQIPCAAQAMGGNINVQCNTVIPGTLIVRENYYSGWTAWMDGQSIPIAQDNWLSVSAPPGKHTYIFRYRPLDVWLGLFVTLAGVAYAFWLARNKEDVSIT